jgi:hypothetical protein
MGIALENLKEEIKKRVGAIKFSPHFYSKKRNERPYLNEGIVERALKDFDNYLGFQKHSVGDKTRFRIGVKLSNKYIFVVVVELKEQGLNIVTAWKTNRKWQRVLQK